MAQHEFYQVQKQHRYNDFMYQRIHTTRKIHNSSSKLWQLITKRISLGSKRVVQLFNL